MGAVAERLGCAAAAAAERGARDAGDYPARAAGDLQIAPHGERPIQLRIDGQDAIASGKHVGLASWGLARGREADLMMRAVAEGLVLGSAAAAERRAESARFAIDLELSAKCIRPGLADTREIHRRRSLIVHAIAPLVSNGTGGTRVSDLD